MKKIIGFFAVLFIIFALFSGCGSEEGTGERGEIQPQAVMIDGTLYYSTNRHINYARCGVMDGKIKSTVSRYQLPRKDNQSNFGKGYEYQFVDSHHCDIPIDNIWIRFCDGDCDDDHSRHLYDDSVMPQQDDGEDMSEYLMID